MATLFNTKIKDTYQSLLKLEDNTILTTTTKNVTDGLGNASPLYMSTTRVGIGTNNPTGVLHVVSAEVMGGNNGGQIALSQSGASPAVIGIQGSGWNTFGIWGISRFTTTSVPDLRVFADGKVSASVSLLVGSITASTAKLTVRGDGSSSATTSLLVQNSSAQSALTILDDRTSAFGSNVSISPTSGGSILLGVDSNIMFRITDGSGYQKFSIARGLSGGALSLSGGSQGATSYNLSDSGHIFSFPSSNNNADTVTITRPFRGNINLSTINLLNITSTNEIALSNATLLRGLYINPTVTDWVSVRAIETTAGNVIFNGGNVGIGTSSPTEKLDLAGNFKLSGNIVLGDATGGSGGGFQVYKNSNVYTYSLVHCQSHLIYLFANPQGSIYDGFPAQSTGIRTSGKLLFMPDGATAVTMLGNGNVLIGTTTDSGFKLDVNGTLRSGIIYLTGNNGKIQYSTDIYMQFPAQGGPIAGVFADGGYGWNFNSTQTYSTLRPGNGTTTPSTWTLSQSTKSFGRNTFHITTDLTNASGSSNVGETITLLNVNGNSPTAAYAYRPSLKVRAGNSGTHSGADQYAGSGHLYLESGDANSGTATDVAGGTIFLNSGRGTGTGTPGNIIFSTATATTTGTTLQTLSERMRIDGSGNVGVGEASLTARLQVKGSGSTSATTALLVQNSAGTAALNVNDAGQVCVGGTNTFGYTFLVSGITYLNGSTRIDGNTTINGGFTVTAGTILTGGRTVVRDGNSLLVGGTPGFDTPNASAAVEIRTTTKGFLPPVMTTAEKNLIATPATGLMVFDTTLARPCFFNGATWVTM
jgi:hypothetical protein